jgi:hypothetical protein
LSYAIDLVSGLLLKLNVEILLRNGEKMNILHKIKYRFFESYRIKIGVGLSPLRNENEYKALLEFCRNELKDTENMKLNPERKRIYETTLLLDREWNRKWDDNSVPFVEFKPVGRTKRYCDPMDFIQDHVGWYWN